MFTDNILSVSARGVEKKTRRSTAESDQWERSAVGLRPRGPAPVEARPLFYWSPLSIAAINNQSAT